MDNLEEERKAALRDYLHLTVSEEYLDDDKKAIEKAAELKAKIDRLDFESMTERQQFRKSVQDALDQED